MNRIRSIRSVCSIRSAAGAILALMAFALTHAAEIVKSIDRDGRVVYSDHPVPGTRAEKILAAPPSPEADNPARARALQTQRQSAEAQRRAHERSDSWDRADAELRSATEALSAARDQAERGLEPESGEVMAAGKGLGVRRLPIYFERQEALERQASEAQQRFDRALAAKNELRE